MLSHKQGRKRKGDKDCSYNQRCNCQRGWGKKEKKRRAEICKTFIQKNPEDLGRVLGLRTVGDSQRSMTEAEQKALYLCMRRAGRIAP